MMAASSSYTRGPWYNALRFEPGKDNLFSTRDEDAHKKLRNKMAVRYSGKENPSLEWSVDAQIANLIKLLETKYQSTEQEYDPVDFAEKAQFFTLEFDFSVVRPEKPLEITNAGVWLIEDFSLRVSREA
ncbi:hypothetical protein ACHAPU_006867 [Fusarium lateritium]